MSDVLEFLSRLKRVKQIAPDRWRACCPAHDDRTPSLSVRQTDDQRVLVHCWVGCDVHAIVSAVGMTLLDLAPPRILYDHIRPERSRWLPHDAFEVLRREAAILAVIAADMHKGREINEGDFQRLEVAMGRINDITECCYARAR